MAARRRSGLTWAWAIVALTLIVRIVIVPLTIKQIRSMQRLQVHAPELKAIQQKYKHDKPKMNEEVMKFYKENKVNPLASCLPLVLQIPIFFALFFVLRDFDDEVFPKYPDSDLGWLHVVPNITENVNTHWSGWLLLVIYVGSQLASTFFMSTTMDQRQRYIFLALPFVVIPFVLNFPIGLMLYWSTTNLWTVGQGLITRRLVPKPQPPPKRSSRTPPKERAPADGRSARRNGLGHDACEAGRKRSAAGQAQEEEGLEGEAVSAPENQAPDDGVVESEGETVGEAKWTALRELERRFPGLDKAQVRFTVVSEGERGLLGVGQVPARVLARVEEAPRPASAGERGAGLARGEAPRGARAGLLVARRALQDRHRRGRRAHLRDADRARARSGHREARAHDRRDPVPGERDPLARFGGRAQRGDRRRSRVPRAAAELPGGHGRPGSIRCVAGRARGVASSR